MSGPFGNASGGSFAFGQTPVTTQTQSLFGTNPATSGTGFAFGSSAAFGKPQQQQPQQQQQQPQQNAQSGFLFAGSPQTTSTFGFGSQPTQQPVATSTSFASPPAPTTPFGAQPQSTPFGGSTGLNFSGGSMFNTTTAAATATPVLGFSTPSTQSTTGFGGFTSSTPAFGSAPAATSTTGQTGGFSFGSLAAASQAAIAATPTATFGGMGQPASTVNQLTGNSLFKTAGSMLGTSTPNQAENQLYAGVNLTAPATTTTGNSLTFGSLTQPAATPFRNNNQPTTAFGTTTQQSSISFGASTQPTSNTFGASTQPSSNTFGASTQPSSNTFGASTQPSSNSFVPSTQPSSNTFGANTQSSNLSFGSTVPPSVAPFGTTTQPSSVAFGGPQQQQQQQQQANTGSIFGQMVTTSEQSIPAVTSIFGQSLAGSVAPSLTPVASTALSSSIFGQSTQSIPALGSMSNAPVYQFGPSVTSTTTPVATAAGGTLPVSTFSGLGGGIKLGGVTTTSTPVTFPNTSAIAFASPLTTPASTAITPLSGFSIPSLAKTSTLATTSDTTPTFNLTGTGTVLGGSSTSAVSVTSTSGFSLPSSIPTSSSIASAVAPSLAGLSATSVATSTTVTSSAAVTSGMNFRQLEETINKWTTELEEQEKIYLNQATQVNAWDRMLIKNGEKITQLNDSLERVKLDQQHLEHEIDFILAQQKELEDLLTPLEQHVDQTPSLSVQQHADIEREHTYELAENIDAQMKRMAEDLKEIIDHVNASNSNQDNTDPVYQVGKILNAHMDSLQWIEQNTNLVQRKLEEVSQLYEVRRKDQERRFRLAYE